MKNKVEKQVEKQGSKRVLVAMSGGVDSSMAAALLKQKGFEVVGITMYFILGNFQRKKSRLQALKNIEDARRIAHKLGIVHYIVDMQKVLNQRVIKDFCQEYSKGRTPNPCVRCNQYLKFDALLKKAEELGADFLATGHYARIVKTEAGYQLRKGKDLFKDQSYFLYRLGQKQLKRILFPLGIYTKSKIVKLANKFKFASANRLESQEICFLADENYRQFIKTRIKGKIKPGDIVDAGGNKLGSHKGIAFYTIGQREGLGIAKGYPLYISRIDSKKNQIIVGPREGALSREFLVKQPNFILNPIKKKIALKVRIRYNHKEEAAEVSLQNSKLKVKYKEPQFAITPGQSAVFYDQDSVVGGGIIDKVLD
ncbi:MAG: tRNA 2-thiouridine(34) synthase MnmA [Candidatus Omnitrophica bacterium]|nr:tRNA 2-thiouridine(34) synthase MnmA [Candidatus Omnitrophota bacterium]